MSDSGREITNLIYRYAELLDAGDMDAVAAYIATLPRPRVAGAMSGDVG